jgi:hypothetical protein
MSTDQQDVNVEASLNKSPSDEPQNVGYDAFSAFRSQPPPETEAVVEEEQPPESDEIPQDAPTPEAEPPPVDNEGITEPVADAFDADTVLSQIEQLSKEDRKKLQDRSVERYAELTARAKNAEQHMAELEGRLAEKDNPLERSEAVENNPFSNIATVEALQEEYDNWGKTFEWADDLLDEHEGESYDSVIAEVDGKELTKRQVRDFKKKAIQSRDKFLPARLKELQQDMQLDQFSKGLEAKAEAELEWLKDDENDTRKAYEAAMADPRAQQILESSPTAKAFLPYYMKHAFNSMSQMQQKEQPIKKSSAPAKPPKPTPPNNPPANAGMRPATNDEKLNKHLKELTEKYQTTGDIADWQALRALQKS